jgi:xylose dehydrogenase (NAD/NADP)
MGEDTERTKANKGGWEMSKTNKPIRWGVLSTARCAKERLIPAIQAAHHSELLAIASRDQAKAEACAQEFNIPRVYGSYEEILEDPEIDAVYIPLPNHLHAEWTVRAAEAGKHILCEKPAALNQNELLDMLEACRKNNVVFMEAFAFRSHPEWLRLRKILESNAIGEIRNVQAHYSILVENKEDIRLSPAKGGGALYDVGSYCINAIRYIMNSEPEEVQSFAKLDSSGMVDLTTSSLLRFSGGRIAQFECSIESFHRQSIDITGSAGAIKVTFPFRHPRLMIQKDGMEQTDIFEFQVDQYTTQVENFIDCILDGKKLWYGPEESLANLKVIDTINKLTKNLSFQGS